MTQAPVCNRSTCALSLRARYSGSVRLRQDTGKYRATVESRTRRYGRYSFTISLSTLEAAEIVLPLIRERFHVWLHIREGDLARIQVPTPIPPAVLVPSISPVPVASTLRDTLTEWLAWLGFSRGRRGTARDTAQA